MFYVHEMNPWKIMKDSQLLDSLEWKKWLATNVDPKGTKSGFVFIVDIH